MKNIIKKLTLLSTIMLASALLLTACAPRTYKDYVDSGKRIAVELGDVYGDLSRDFFKAATQGHSNTDNMIEALRLGRVDAILISSGFVRHLQNSGQFDDFTYIEVPDYVYTNKAAHIFHTEELRDKYNEWFAGIKEDGTFEEILNRWLSGQLPEFEDIPIIELTGENGTLKVCDTGNYPPLSYYENGVLVGFDMEMAQRFAQFLGMDLDVTIVDYDEIENYIAAGRFDMSAATKAVTDERKDNIIFGEPSVITEAVLIVVK
jgi:polar amino acid transport system substrate-binding protein